MGEVFEMTDLRQDTFFIGRSDELYTIIKNLQSGIHTLLTGDKGVGKSRLMIEALKVLNGEVKSIAFDVPSQAHIQSNDERQSNHRGVRINPNAHLAIYVKYSSPLSSALKQTAEALFQYKLLRVDTDEDIYEYEWDDVQKKFLKAYSGNLGMQDLIFQSIKASSKRIVVVFDNLDRVTPAHQAFLEMILGVATIGAATILLRDDIHLKKVWASFEKIEISPLSDIASEYLADHLFSQYPIKVIDREFFKRQVLKAASGNPFHIKNYLWQGSCRKYIAESDVRNIQEIDANKFINLGPVYVFVLISFTVIKIFSTGVTEREGYIYFTGIGFLAMVIFRVFRNFFIFKPQKQTSYYRS
ncbi:MAG TPA: AAA family ATPase [Cyclobacteriaceae bacterium]|nr:AAA family ATPase [Cyclobacteriaceae bacterium]